MTRPRPPKRARKPAPLPPPHPDAVAMWEAHLSWCPKCPSSFCIDGIDLQAEAMRLKEMMK